MLCDHLNNKEVYKVKHLLSSLIPLMLTSFFKEYNIKIQNEILVIQIKLSVKILCCIITKMGIF